MKRGTLKLTFSLNTLYIYMSFLSYCFLLPLFLFLFSLSLSFSLSLCRVTVSRVTRREPSWSLPAKTSATIFICTDLNVAEEDFDRDLIFSFSLLLLSLFLWISSLSCLSLFFLCFGLNFLCSHRVSRELSRDRGLRDLCASRIFPSFFEILNDPSEIYSAQLPHIKSRRCHIRRN